ncbi:hypothetical protein BCR35DRAFT_308946 [Leucosporidium creatinivorum]|uniref:Uncharacterized protein n=1 Tax=Leucosporidium creatinivorum TaxID=106004 RepID=A0A1Y2DU80_9BASI|nr:hypothetical protein BCR35DRAFT_308946 [Leucosporidium creatinivorum]
MPSARSLPIPKYRPSILSSRLPPAKLPIFRARVSHPTLPFAAEEAKKSVEGGKAPTTLSGAHQLIYTTAPRPLIPLTNSPTNHKLWNPPAADAKGSRQVEKDESGRLARFASRFGGAPVEGEKEKGQFGVESDLSFLEGVTTQSPGTALGKRDIVGPQKSAKKGKK